MSALSVLLEEAKAGPVARLHLGDCPACGARLQFPAASKSTDDGTRLVAPIVCTALPQHHRYTFVSGLLRETNKGRL